MEQQVTKRQANYFNLILPVMQATEIINKESSEVLVPTLYDKIVYCYILHYHKIYSEAGGAMYESQDSIADNIGVDRKTVNRSIKKLCGIGLITKNVKIEVKGNVKRKHATYSPYDVSLGDKFMMKQMVVVRDEKGYGAEQSLYYEAVPVQQRNSKSSEGVFVGENVFAPDEPLSSSVPPWEA